jgi:hypothetical protein
MKKNSLSILFSLIILNPLFCMENIILPQPDPVQNASDPNPSQPDTSALQNLSEQIDTLTQAVQAVEENSTVEPAQEAKIQEELSTFSKILEKLSCVPGKACAVFGWLSNRLDTILTVKGAVKTALLLGIVFVIVRPFLPAEFLKTVVEVPVNATVNGASVISTAAMNGFLAGTEQAFEENGELFNKITSKLAEIQAKAQINADYTKATAPYSSWSLFGQSATLAASSSAGTIIALALKTLIEGFAKKRLGL